MLCNFINQETVTVYATAHPSLLATYYLYNSMRTWNLHTENFNAILKSDEHAETVTLCVLHVELMHSTYVVVCVYVVCAVNNFIKLSEIIYHFLQVLDKYNPPDHFLPESYTCFFLLKMPRYSCKVRMTLCIWSCMLKGNFFSFVALICCDKLNTACGFTEASYSCPYVGRSPDSKS